MLQDQTSNYYTPDISELFYGYECESLNGHWGKGADRKPWFEKYVVGQDLADYKEIRTLYLTKEQIEAEGWSHYAHVNGRDEYQKGDFLCTTYSNLNPYTGRICIRSRDNKGDTLFTGQCKSINEFRRICKLVGIEKKDVVKT